MTKERDALAVKLASMESERTAPSISRPAPKLPSAVVLGDEFGIFDEPEKPRPKPQKEEKGDDVTLISDDSDLGVTMPGFNAFRSKLPAKKPDAGNAMPRKPLLPRNNINEPSLLKGEKRPYLDSLDGGKAKKKSVVDEQRGFMKSWMGGRT